MVFRWAVILPPCPGKVKPILRLRQSGKCSDKREIPPSLPLNNAPPDGKLPRLQYPLELTEKTMSFGQLLSDNIKRSKGMVEQTLAGFSEEQMFYRPAKGANHAVWQLGHLTNATWGMVAGCDPTAKAPAQDSRFSKEAAGSDDPTKFPKKAEAVKAFADAMDAAADWAAKLTEADLAKPAPERMRSFVPTVGDVAVVLSGHAMMHLGQFQVMRRGLGMPVLF
jgi:hypothetical protein